MQQDSRRRAGSRPELPFGAKLCKLLACNILILLLQCNIAIVQGIFVVVSCYVTSMCYLLR